VTAWFFATECAILGHLGPESTPCEIRNAANRVPDNIVRLWMGLDSTDNERFPTGSVVLFLATYVLHREENFYGWTESKANRRPDRL
jgi:hypothetical protein